eukprot:TRINITY_DN23481_c0_g1_i1.p1 TRINITY_DN23481_c0_g1~~TRINITY_DN23481_c0_g1_i1.p1  ORF type:complete len:1218 (-),score=320.31 TRINITY_DN23481_c0_g1_i1:56-3709(-)
MASFLQRLVGLGGASPKKDAADSAQTPDDVSAAPEASGPAQEEKELEEEFIPLSGSGTKSQPSSMSPPAAAGSSSAAAEKPSTPAATSVEAAGQTSPEDAGEHAAEEALEEGRLFMEDVTADMMQVDGFAAGFSEVFEEERVGLDDVAADVMAVEAEGGMSEEEVMDLGDLQPAVHAAPPEPEESADVREEEMDDESGEEEAEKWVDEEVDISWRTSEPEEPAWDPTPRLGPFGAKGPGKGKIMDLLPVGRIFTPAVRRLPAEDAWEAGDFANGLPGATAAGAAAGGAGRTGGKRGMQTAAAALAEAFAGLGGEEEAAEEEDRRPWTEKYPMIAAYRDKLKAKAQPALVIGGQKRRRILRYYSAGAMRLEKNGYTDDGHPLPVRKGAKPECEICRDTDHAMGECPMSRCHQCFQTYGFRVGHKCPAELDAEDELQEVVEASRQELNEEDIVPEEDEDMLPEEKPPAPLPSKQWRCMKCGVLGHVNCGDAPVGGWFEEDDEEAVRGMIGANAGASDAIAAPYDTWAEAVSLDQAGSTMMLQGAVLRLLMDGKTQLDEIRVRAKFEQATPDDISDAVRKLHEIRTLIPAIPRRSRAADTPTLSALGWWLAPLQLPPYAAHALLQGALWGVLLPMVVLVVLMETELAQALADKDFQLLGRKSAHYELAASYFRWREGRPSGWSGFFASDAFWEVIDRRVLAACKHAQQAMSYDGDDAAFEEMDGELMDVRRRDGRPWTLASAFGTESSSRWARFTSALSAAYPPQLSADGQWLCTTVAEGRLGCPSTVVSGAHAVLYSAGELRSKGSRVVEANGIPGTLVGGDGALDEAQVLREELQEKVSHALDGGDAVVHVMDEGLQARCLEFLQTPASEFVTAPGVVRVSGPEEKSVAIDVADILRILERNEEAGAIAPAGGLMPPAPVEHTAPVSLAPASPPAAAPFVDVPAIASPSPEPLMPLLPTVPTPKTSHFSHPKHDASSLLLMMARQALATGDGDAAAGSGAVAPVGATIAPSAAPAMPPVASPAMPALPSANVPAEASEDDSWLESWAHAAARLALVAACKKQAIADEDYDRAASLKGEAATCEEHVSAARNSVFAYSGQRHKEELDRIAVEKKKAVENEDFPLAAKLKKQEQALLAEPAFPPPGELERLNAEKKAAVAAEDYASAAEIRAQQQAVEASFQRLEQRVKVLAAEWALAQSSGASGKDAEAWQKAAEALRA